MSTKTLSLKTKLGYGICDMGGNLFFTLIGFYLYFFLTDGLGLTPFYTGIAMVIGRVWDAVTDPLVGYLSERTKSRFGRRRPYMFIGAILLFVGGILMFMQPHFSSDFFLFLWVTFAYCFFNTAYTLVNIPYGALAPELTNDYKEQSDLNGTRMFFAILGTLSCIVIGQPLIATIGWTAMGAVMGAIMMITALITVIVIKEPKKEIIISEAPRFREYLEILKQREFLTILIPWSVNIGGINIIMAVLIPFFKYIYMDQDAAGLGIVLLLVASLSSVFVWVQLSKKIGKKWAYIIGLVLFSVMIMIFFLFGQQNGIVFAYVIMALAGLGHSTNYVMPFSLIPDVVEWDYAQRGKRREGIYYGLWTFCSKLGQALAIGTVALVHTLFGYIEQAPTQTLAAQFSLKLLLGPIAVGFFVVGMVTLAFYPISPKVYQGILDKIKAREAEKN
ncbi:MAG: MFS transporter [Spirochaetales bacterium]|nr:MFS transporter [Spirochaetales bacterium]